MIKKQLSKKDAKELNEKIKQLYNIDDFFSKKDNLEEIKDEFTIIKKDSLPVFFYKDEILIPTLKLLQTNLILPTATIDMPAIKFITNGADIMKPGIKEFDEFPKDAFIAIVVENNKKPLAIGKALISSEEMKSTSEGKVILNIHYVGDSLWNFI